MLIKFGKYTLDTFYVIINFATYALAALSSNIFVNLKGEIKTWGQLYIKKDSSIKMRHCRVFGEAS